MRRIRRSGKKSSDGPPSDGAELPLLDPRLLGQLASPGKGKRTPTPEGDCLILSDDALDLYDVDRVDEVRHALSSEHAFSDWPGGPRVERRLPRWEKVLWAAALVAFAVAVGATIGLVL